MDHDSGIRLPDDCKLTINRKKDNNVTICFDVAVFLLSSLVTGPSFTSISWLVLELWHFLFIKDRPGIGKSEIPPSGFCQLCERLGQIKDNKFGKNVSNKKLLNTAKYQGYCFWVNKGKPKGEGINLTWYLKAFCSLCSLCWNCLTLSWRSSLSYQNQSIDLLCNSMDWFLYDRDLRHERVKCTSALCLN